MRKQFFTLLGLLFAASSFAQDDQFRMLNRSEITTGILHDKVYSWSDPARYNGVNDTVSSYDNWRQLYYEMYNASITSPRFPSIEVIEEKAFRFFDSTEAIPLFIANFRYNKIKSYAIDSNLLSFDGTLFHDIAGRTESPYEEHRFFAAGITIQEFDENAMTFYIGQQFLLTNVSEQPSAIEVDFGDGNGFRTVGWNTFHTINYFTVSDRIIRIQLQFSSGKLSASILLTADVCGFAPTWCTMIQPDLPPWVPPPPIKFPFEIQANIDYPVGSGQKAKGNAYLRYGVGPQTIDKVFIFVEGIDFGGIHTGMKNGSFGWCLFVTGGMCGFDEQYGFLEKAPQLLNALYNAGYDVFLLDFRDGADYIQRNAMLLVKLIQLVNQYKSGNEPIIVGGTSMGGQVSRYALAYMEKNNLPHCTRLWVSQDSPHKGANIPLGLQNLTKFFAEKANSAGAQSLLNYGLNRPASGQLMVYHVTPQFGNMRVPYVADLATIGYPSKLRKVAVSNGSINGVGLPFNPGNQLLRFEYTPAVSFWLCDGAMLLKGNVFAIKDGTSAIFRGKVPKAVNTLQMCLVQSAFDPEGCSICVNQNSHISNIFPGFVSPPFDNAPGGTRPSIEQARKSIYDGLPSNIKNDPLLMLDALYQSHSFIPTISSLDVNTSDLFFNVSNNIDPFNPNPLYPFDAYYGPGNNQTHSEITDAPNGGNIQFVLDEIFRGTNLLQSPHSSLSPNGGIFNYGRKPSVFIGSVDIDNGGKVYVNANMLTDYGSATSPPVVPIIPNPGSTFTLKTYDCGTVININAGGEFILGELSPNNKAIVKIKSGSTLKIGNGGKLIIHNNSSLVIEPGASFILDPGAEIQLIGPNALINVQDINTSINIPALQQILITKTAAVSQGGTIQFAGGNFSLSGTLINENCYIKIGGQMTFNYSA